MDSGTDPAELNLRGYAKCLPGGQLFIGNYQTLDDWGSSVDSKKKYLSVVCLKILMRFLPKT